MFPVSHTRTHAFLRDSVHPFGFVGLRCRTYQAPLLITSVHSHHHLQQQRHRQCCSSLQQSEELHQNHTDLPTAPLPSPCGQQGGQCTVKQALPFSSSKHQHHYQHHHVCGFYPNTHTHTCTHTHTNSVNRLSRCSNKPYTTNARTHTVTRQGGGAGGQRKTHLWSC